MTLRTIPYRWPTPKTLRIIRRVIPQSLANIVIKMNPMQGRRLDFLVLMMFVLTGTACISWYGLFSCHPGPATAAKDESSVGSQDTSVAKQVTAPVQDPSGGSDTDSSTKPVAEGANVRRLKLGIRGQPAPSLQIDRWYNLPPGKTSINVTDYRGKVIYLYGFQSWCPGCHRYGFPTLTELIRHYKDTEDVAFIAVQTTFEGFGANTPQRAKETTDRYSLSIPVGHSGSPRQPSAIMQRYRTGGTPWTVIIDRDGMVRFNDFHIQRSAAVAMIDRLLTSRD